MDAYSQLGYVQCSNGNLVAGSEKIAIFAIKSPESPAGLKPTHAARQLTNGCWTSKLGKYEDISHSDVNDVASPGYGYAVVFMIRPRNCSQD